jgi:hypothetical protein
MDATKNHTFRFDWNRDMLQEFVVPPSFQAAEAQNCFKASLLLPAAEIRTIKAKAVQRFSKIAAFTACSSFGTLVLYAVLRSRAPT